MDGEKVNMANRFAEVRGNPAGIKKAKQDFPKARIMAVNIDKGWMIVRFDKHSLILKLCKDFNLKFRFVEWKGGA